MNREKLLELDREANRKALGYGLLALAVLVFLFIIFYKKCAADTLAGNSWPKHLEYERRIAEALEKISAR